MAIKSTTELKELLQEMTGAASTLDAPEEVLDRALAHLEGAGLGYSQFNELLLSLGLERVKPAFFAFLVSGEACYQPGSSLTADSLNRGFEEFLKIALLIFGNVGFAFRQLSQFSESQLKDELSALRGQFDASDFENRHAAIEPIEPISQEDAFLLGYISGQWIEERLRHDRENAHALDLKQRRREVIEVGKRNHRAYLCSDHLDVYVATSMREPHEFFMVREGIERIFSDPGLRKLNPRYFDPTQAYCTDRIDKGLSEALMLKRAKCTVYFAQESDTLGKDSELASTLAQGKPVIAYIPSLEDLGPDEFFATLVKATQVLHPEVDPKEMTLGLIRHFDSSAAWVDSELRKWLDDPSAISLESLRERLLSAIEKQWDSRASLLEEKHPLGVQVDLATGVANGVLVARTPDQCAEIVRRIMTGTLEFDIDRSEIEGNQYLMLRERVSGCVFRVVTGDPVLTNSFWQFYLG